MERINPNSQVSQVRHVTPTQLLHGKLSGDYWITCLTWIFLCKFKKEKVKQKLNTSISYGKITKNDT